MPLLRAAIATTWCILQSVNACSYKIIHIFSELKITDVGNNLAGLMQHDTLDHANDAALPPLYLPKIGDLRDDAQSGK